MTAEAQISCRGLSRRLKSGSEEIDVLRDVDLDIKAGEFVAILGPSGSGKSTLLGLMAGIDRPSAGTIRFEGHDLVSMNEDELARMRRGQIGFVFQNFQLIENLTATENVLLAVELAGQSRADERSRELLERVGLPDRGHHYPAQLSGGEQQRVALARAFAPAPKLLLADEPTGNLDRATGARVIEVMLGLKSEQGTTLVLVTHDPELAARADRRLSLHEGRLVDAEELA